MTDVNVSLELQMSKLGEEVDAAKVQKIVTTFMTKCVHRFFHRHGFQVCHKHQPASSSAFGEMHVDEGG